MKNIFLETNLIIVLGISKFKKKKLWEEYNNIVEFLVDLIN